jgi:hypothetical protein
MPVASAMPDIVTPVSPRSLTSAAAASRTAPRTLRRCSSTVSLQSLGTTRAYDLLLTEHNVLLRDTLYCKVHDQTFLPRSTGTEMTDAPPPSPTSQGGYDATPRWVKALVVIAVAVVVLVAVLLLAGGDHGPGRHLGAGGTESLTTTAEGHAPWR